MAHIVMHQKGRFEALKDDYDGVPDPRKRDWLKRARDHGRLHDSFIEILPGTPEFHTWAAYFDGMGWRPVTFPRGLSKGGGVLVLPAGTRSWTAPCRWPADLGF